MIWHDDDDCVVISGVCLCVLCSCECHEIIVWFYYEGLECWFRAILLQRIYIFHFLWKNGRLCVGVYACVRPCVRRMANKLRDVICNNTVTYTYTLAHTHTYAHTVRKHWAVSTQKSFFCRLREVFFAVKPSRLFPSLLIFTEISTHSLLFFFMPHISNSVKC